MLSNTQAYTTHVPFFPLKSELRDICWMLCVLWCRSNQELKTQETTVSGMWEWAKSSWDNYSSGQEDCFPRRFFQSRLFSHLMTDTTYWEPKSLIGGGWHAQKQQLAWGTQLASCYESLSKTAVDQLDHSIFSAESFNQIPSAFASHDKWHLSFCL